MLTFSGDCFVSKTNLKSNFTPTCGFLLHKHQAVSFICSFTNSFYGSSNVSIIFWCLLSFVSLHELNLSFNVLLKKNKTWRKQGHVTYFVLFGCRGLLLLTFFLCLLHQFSPAVCPLHTTAVSVPLHATCRVMNLKSAWQKSMRVETEECGWHNKRHHMHEQKWKHQN